ncbi:hypothetical protein [Ferrimonas senticii]|uniref:hypothetical protein n=1 Tax=Ferrimonas senticii TaxID=394566 RepID=UPI0004077A3E|nr:hypothetical protein [Ferrimonas senticii]
MSQLSDEILALRQWVHVAHHIPGRIRLRFNSALVARLANQQTEQAMQHALQFEPLTRYQINSDTSSVLLEYQPAIVPPALLDQAFSLDHQQAHSACTQLIELLTPYYQAGGHHG